MTSRTERIALRAVADGDLAAFFDQQLDREAQRMAAFIADDPADRAAFEAHWARIRSDPTIRTATIVFDGAAAGHIAAFERWGLREVGYWIGREWWGRGVATAALAAFVRDLPERPIHARVAADNAGSIRVLQKCGFGELRRERAFAAARGAQIEEIVFIRTDR